MTHYEVIGRCRYREHDPGTVFEATLDRLAETRALRRGDIRIVKTTRPSLVPGSWRLPDGWERRPAQHQRSSER